MRCGGEEYELSAAPFDPARLRCCWELTKLEGKNAGEIHVVWQDNALWLFCDCPGWRWRHRPGRDGRNCRHIEALLDAGFLTEGNRGEW